MIRNSLLAYMRNNPSEKWKTAAACLLYCHVPLPFTVPYEGRAYLFIYLHTETCLENGSISVCTSTKSHFIIIFSLSISCLVSPASLNASPPVNVLSLFSLSLRLVRTGVYKIFRQICSLCSKRGRSSGHIVPHTNHNVGHTGKTLRTHVGRVRINIFIVVHHRHQKQIGTWSNDIITLMQGWEEPLFPLCNDSLRSLFSLQRHHETGFRIIHVPTGDARKKLWTQHSIDVRVSLSPLLSSSLWEMKPSRTTKCNFYSWKK